MAWRSLITCISLLAGAGLARGEAYTLQEKDLVGSYFQVQIRMKLDGKIKFHRDGEMQSLAQTATAAHDFVERVLLAGEHGVLGKTARYYTEARAEIRVAGDRAERRLGEDHRLIVAQRVKDRLVAFTPKGPMTREELDVLQHFDTLAIPGLLPEQAVEVGAAWKPHSAAVQALCCFEGLTANDLTCKLDGVSGGVATVSVQGTAGGIDTGAAVKLKVTGSFRFDLGRGRVVQLTWRQSDVRDQGPASPAMEAEVTVEVVRTPAEPAQEVNDFALVPVPADPTPPPALLLVDHADPKNRYRLAPERDWVTVARTDEHLVLRLLDRGDFVAQATVTAWPKAEAGKHMTGDEFLAAMEETPGWEPEEVLESGEVKVDANWVYRVAASGQLNGLKTVQYFYLVAGPQGDQLVVAFTMTAGQVQKLGSRDLDLVRSVAFPASAESKVSTAGE